MAWDYTKTEYEKQKTADPKWHLERLVLYGLQGEKIRKDALKAHLQDLHIPEERKAFLELLVHGR